MEPASQTSEVGYVISSRNYLVYLDGLPTIHINDLVANDQGLIGLVSTLYPDSVEVLMLEDADIHPGERFRATGRTLAITVGDFLLGRSINPLGVPIDGKGMLAKTVKGTSLELEQPAKGIDSREFIADQLVTGISLIDNLVPIGKGQRELVIGDNHSGITNFLVDLIVNQNSNSESNQMVCIYGAIGKPVTSIKNLINTLQVNKAISHSIIIATSSTEVSPLIFLTPMAAFTVAEYFQQKGKDVLLILDDMGNHAKVYREIALLGGQSPGRESFPGDIFYQHARLMERAGKFNKNFGGGSITALPVVELNLNDFTGFIPTNLMSITDGHLLFKANLYNKNQRPAVDITLSVSRVGRQTQKLVNSLLSRKVRQTLAQADDLETISRFSAELPPETQLILRQKSLVEEAIRQEDLTFIPLAIQTIILALIYTSFLADKNDTFLQKYKGKIMQQFISDPGLLKITQMVPNLKNDTELIKALEGVVPKLVELCK